jgi:pyruvate/2-oxoglutarate dehydrogenase complex dihydrolipoamide acyltransferase (E2) component
MGMFTSGAAVVIPITPMTLTMSIGSTEKKLVLQDGQVVERDFIHLNINVDHAIIDGAPLMRFVHRFKEVLLKGPSLAPEQSPQQRPASTKNSGENYSPQSP